MVLMLSLLFLIVPQSQPAPRPQPAQPEGAIATAAFAVLQKNCAGCHSDTGFAKSYLLLDRSAMVKAGKITPGNAAESMLYKRITGAIEPLMPEGGTKLADADIATIKRWIDDGAPDWKPSATELRRFISTDDIIASIEKDLATAGTEMSRPFFRYFTLTNLYNAGDPRLATYRSALFKLVNSLSWDKNIALPTVIDREQTIFRIDIREYDWTDPAATWETILEGYPYGVDYSNSAYARVQAMASSRIPFIRADWFIAAASMPPLYHEILELPTNEADLETCGRNNRRCLNIDTERNLRDSPGLRVVRAGFTESGVSNSNRVVERHRSPHGAYWKSHDFADNLGRHNIFKHPLDFERAGGEIIFNLPNGLQAYLLVNERGERLDQAPTNIVFNKGASRAEIRNGLSCMTCHANGMRSLTDDVRATLGGLPESERSYAASLYPESSVMKNLLAEDQSRFEAAVRKSGVQPGVEPIGELAERYATSIDAVAAASELGWTKEEFQLRLRQSDYLRQLGLAPLLTGGTVKRDAWEDVYGDVAQEFRAGFRIEPTRAYGERFFTGSPAPVRSRRLPASNPADRISSLLAQFAGKPVRSLTNGWDRTYSIRDVRSPGPCSIEVRDVTRLSSPADASQFWIEEDTQSFALSSVRASLAPEGTASRITIKSDTQTIRLDRSFSSSNRWTDSSLPRSGTALEWVREVIFDLPQGAESNRAFESLRTAIAECAGR